MRLIYCDAGLQSNVGHFATQCRLLLGAFGSLGIPTIVAANRSIDRSLARELGAKELFSLSPYARTSDDPLCGWLKSFSDVSAVFASDFRKIEGLEPTDLLYYDTATPAPLMGLVAWLQSTFTPERCPCVVAALIEHSGLVAHWSAEGAMELRPQGTDSLLYRYVSLLIDPAFASRISFVSTDATLAQAYTSLLNRQVVCLPHPYQAIAYRDRKGASPVTVGFLGAQRENKGFKLVPEIVSKLLAQTSVRVLVHNSWRLMQEEMALLSSIAARNSRLEMVHETKDPHGWAELLASCDLLVAPYDRRQYAISGSGIVFEGLANGIPLVVPTRTALERALREYGEPGIAFESVTPDGVVAAVIDAVARYDELAERAAVSAAHWAQRNGPRRTAEAVIATSQAGNIYAP